APAFIDEMLRELPWIDAAFGRAPDDLVVHVGPVADVPDLPARPAQEANRDVEGDQEAGVPDVGHVVDGDPAHVDAQLAGLDRDELLLPIGERVPDAQRHSRSRKGDGREHSTRARARRGLSRSWSAVEDLLQVRFDLVLVDALGERQLLDEEMARRFEHLALTNRT